MLPNRGTLVLNNVQQRQLESENKKGEIIDETG